jgi:hypothetical protein
LAVLIVLLTSWLAFRIAGGAGVLAMASWRDAARYALVVMFLFTATAHFNKMKHDLAHDSGVLSATFMARVHHRRFGVAWRAWADAPSILEGR